jgi:itaconate CoA-transferase
MAVAEPPAILGALAARAEQGTLSSIRPWYFHSLLHAGSTLLRYELLDRVHPRCMFLRVAMEWLGRPQGEIVA